MKTKEELENIKLEISILNKKLSELSEDELKEVTGGVVLTQGGFFGSPAMSFVENDGKFLSR